MLASAVSFAQNVKETVVTVVDTVQLKIYFRQGSATLEKDFRDNGASLSMLTSGLNQMLESGERTIGKIKVESGVSPEGSTTFNDKLSADRGKAVRDYIVANTSLKSSQIEVVSLGIDWDLMITLVQKSNLNTRAQVVDIVRNVPIWISKNGKVVDGRIKRLKDFDGGQSWNWMLKNIYPEMRFGTSVSYTVTRNVIREVEEEQPKKEEPRTVDEPVQVVVEAAKKKDFTMAFKTNALADVAMIPNIGIEFYLGSDLSVGADWNYAWWTNNRKFWWKTYGGDIHLRKWFGEQSQTRPLTGHHAGVYAQMASYDFNIGDHGVISYPFSYGGGLEYGYSTPIGKNLNLDFSIGIGCLAGKYEKYTPMEDSRSGDLHYVWQSNCGPWVGPTKAEISLVWILGNNKK